MRNDIIKITNPDGTTIEMPFGCLPEYLDFLKEDSKAKTPTPTKRNEAYPDELLGRMNKELKPEFVKDKSEMRDPIRTTTAILALEKKHDRKICGGMLTLLMNQRHMPIAIERKKNAKCAYRYMERDDFKFIAKEISTNDWYRVREEYYNIINK